jgi:hypothetical protein
MNTIRLAATAALLLGLTGCVVAQPAATYPAGSYPAGSVSTPTTAPVAYGSFCSAGAYQCQLPGPTVVGSSCACPGIGAPSYGVVR